MSKLKARGHILPRKLDLATRMVPCRCGWVVAADSLKDLMGAGWRRGTGNPAGFVCATCAIRRPGQPPQHYEPGVMGDEAVLFANCRKAPKDPFPKIGGDGPEHSQTSRPMEG